MFCWPKGLSSRGMNEFIRRYNDSTELEVETTTWSFGFLMPLNQKTGKGVTVLTGVIAPDPSGKLEYCSTVEVRRVRLEYSRSLRASLSSTVPCD